MRMPCWERCCKAGMVMHYELLIAMQTCSLFSPVAFTFRGGSICDLQPLLVPPCRTLQLQIHISHLLVTGFLVPPALLGVLDLSTMSVSLGTACSPLSVPWLLRICCAV